ncbi:MarR family transcriptional regulator [Microbacterium trichothecenolyticum]|uniref:MarR family winged helix-turn-helix transcriptional regulator n=1 Tax=Microbacterium trichothecenolyticum TaxID=69370 RepID=UPI001C6F3886|nr:MarR family transcriptional regulator [Microbacterium trichothecenolyticum]MBW9120468.1 MarR family transcriptional regulator [Microbacterium trichothecenolyticum]
MAHGDLATSARQRIEVLTLAISVRSLPLMVGSLLKTDLSIQQLKVLTGVVVADISSTSELAASFAVSKATMSKLIDRLVDQALVERVVDEADHRVRRLVPTNLGRQVIAELMAARPEMGADVLRGLDLAELEALETGLRAVNREIQRLSLGSATTKAVT